MKFWYLTKHIIQQEKLIEMFQTDINHFFQSFASEELTAFMRFITTLGYSSFLMLFLIILLFAVDLKKTFLLFMVLLWTANITYCLKNYFDLPRPFHVDSTLEFLDGQLPDETGFTFSGRDAPSFWAGLPADVLEVTRQSKHIEHGLPSGHTSVAIALWGALLLLFRKRWISVLCISLIILSPLSRIYLGVHFLADILSGLALGGAILAIFYALVLKPDKLSTYLQKDHYTIGANAITALFLIIPLLFFFVLPLKVFPLIAYMLGFGTAFLLLSQKGLPVSEAPIPHRIGRTIIGLLIFIAFNVILKKVAEQMGFAENIWADFGISFIGAFALLWLGTTINLRLGWLKRKVA